MPTLIGVSPFRTLPGADYSGARTRGENFGGTRFLC